jgi:serine/threonine protein kinase
MMFLDLKPDNVGVDSNGMVKLFDFGLAKELKEFRRADDGTYQLTSNTGSRRYMAPEVAKRERYNLSVDVFSFGILLWEICALQKPFDGYSELRHYNSVILGHQRPRMDIIKSDKWSVAIRDVMIHCWSPNWEDRPTFRDVVSTLVQAYDGLSQECLLDYKPPPL